MTSTSGHVGRRDVCRCWWSTLFADERWDCVSVTPGPGGVPLYLCQCRAVAAVDVVRGFIRLEIGSPPDVATQFVGW